MHLWGYISYDLKILESLDASNFEYVTQFQLIGVK